MDSAAERVLSWDGPLRIRYMITLARVLLEHTGPSLNFLRTLNIAIPLYV